MLRTIFIAPEVNKRLEVFRRSGKKGALAAIKAEEIVKGIQSGMAPDMAGSMTRHGEGRIKGIFKYDLGSGYRLVCFIKNNCCYLLFAGTHDDCHRWIENNRELDISRVEIRCTEIPVKKKNNKGEKPAYQKLNPVSEEEFDPLKDLAEQDLRKIFCGLAAPAEQE